MAEIENLNAQIRGVITTSPDKVDLESSNTTPSASIVSVKSVQEDSKPVNEELKPVMKPVKQDVRPVSPGESVDRDSLLFKWLESIRLE